MNYSSYQKAIFAQVDSPSNLHIQAVAGSGKTFTLTEFAKLLPIGEANIAIAYNKNIAEDFSRKFPSNTQCSTLHSLGYNLIRQNSKRVICNERKVENILKYKILGYDSKSKTFPDKESQAYFYDWKNEICQLVSLFKGKGLRSSTDIPLLIDTLCMLYEIDKPFEVNLIQEIYDFSLDQTGVIDYDDMILFPAITNYEFPKFKNIFVDEAQDMNASQQLFIQKLCNTHGRLIVAGDTFQAIYGFRGASPESMLEFKMLFNPLELPLSISYRCSKAVVQEAKKIVFQIEAFEEAPEGLVSDCDISYLYENIKDDDFVLSRYTAPLIPVYLKLRSLGKDVRIRGAKIVSALRDSYDSCKKKFSSCNPSTIEQYITYIEEKNWKPHRIKYQKDLLLILLEFAKLLPSEEILSNITRAFSDSGLGITLSTIHGVKGLEAPTVFLIDPDNLPSPLAKQPWEIQQETNLKYVAITRAKESFFYVRNS